MHTVTLVQLCLFGYYHIDKQFSSLTNKVCGIMEGKCVGFPIPDPNACSNQAKTDCPPAEGKQSTDSIVVGVPKLGVSSITTIPLTILQFNTLLQLYTVQNVLCLFTDHRSGASKCDDC